jgi:hypothetical protein
MSDNPQQDKEIYFHKCWNFRKKLKIEEVVEQQIEQINEKNNIKQDWIT